MKEDVLAIIVAVERHRRFVWTAGRVLRETALWTRLEGLPYAERKAILRRLTIFLENLAEQGIPAAPPRGAKYRLRG